MQNNAITLRKRIGSTVYVTRLYVKNDAAETMYDKILRLVRNDLNLTSKNATMGSPQTGVHPTNKGGAFLETRTVQARFVAPFSPQGENADRLPERSSS